MKVLSCSYLKYNPTLAEVLRQVINNKTCCELHICCDYEKYFLISSSVFPLVSGNINIPKSTEMKATVENMKKVPGSPRFEHNTGNIVTMVNCLNQSLS